MNTLWLVSLLITANVVTTEEANKTDALLTEPKNAFKFEDQPDAESYGLIKFEDQDRFQEYSNLDNGFQQYDSPDNRYEQFEGIRNTIDDKKRIKFEDQDRFQEYSNLDNGFQQYDSPDNRYEQFEGIRNTIDDKKRIKFEDQDRFQEYSNLDNGFQQYDSPDNRYEQFEGIRNTIDDKKRIKFEDQDRFQEYSNLDNGFQQYDSPGNRYEQFEGIRNTIDDKKKIKFEDQGITPQQHYSSNTIEDVQRIKFDDNRVNQKPNQQKKKRRRRPKRLPNAQGSGYVRPVYPAPGYPGTPVYPGYPVYPGPPVFGPGPVYPGQGPYQSGYPPLYKPRPSATSALSAVTEALSSIALYDDAQCVPRLLCEAAGGGSVPGAGLIQSIAGLQPLLTLLAAYNGISSSPLFVFGRAVFLGMTSKANPGTCRYAYAQCPNDPEQLVHYLNNHNGGFFRFFAAPELNQPQGLEQFYNQLSGNYGLYQPQQQQNLQQYGSQQNYQQQPLQQQNLQQSYGLQQNNQPQHPFHQQNLQQGYGLQQNYQNPHSYDQLQHGQYQNQYVPQQSYQNQNLQASYGLQHQPFNQNNHQQPGLYNKYGLYGQSYPYQKNLNQNKIQKRIQNIRNTALVNNVNPKWSFPEETSNKYSYSRFGKVLQFPQNNVNSVTAAQGFTFPGIQSNREYAIDSIEADTNPLDHKVNDFELYNRNNYGTVSGGDGFKGSKDNGGVRILYIVRGNGDPNNPEVVRLAPGQSL